MKSLFNFSLILNYYIAGLLLLIAGLLKLKDQNISEIMQILFDRGIISLQLLPVIMKALPIIEISIGILALSGWRSNVFVFILSSIYIVFSGVIIYVSDGYFMQPIDCGCFGENNHDFPVYFLLLRNMTIAILLICYYYKINKNR
ncbi:MAG: hypothetical protein HQK75_14325 [Candidatus Magnetomorum sp.]|nr:hypothetical protein [Candidatus Magnetomorum sp.]